MLSNWKEMVFLSNDIFSCGENFKIYSLINFQIYNIVLLTMVTRLYVTST